MSGTRDELVRDAPGGSPANVPDHICQYEPADAGGRTPPARVEVGGTRIPVINQGIRTEMRKDEAMSITRHSEVYFPRRWNGTDYARAVEALDPNAGNVYDRADIYLRHHVTDDLVLAHRGFVMGSGSGAEGNIERRMTVGDPGQLLSAIPFGNEYTGDTSADRVVQDVIDELRAMAVPTVFDSIGFRERLRTPDGEYVPPLQFDRDARQQIASAREQIDNTTFEEQFADNLASIIDDNAGELLDVLGNATPPQTSAFVETVLDLNADVVSALAARVELGIAPGIIILKGLARLSNFNLGSKKTFKRNEHTAADALAWLEQQLDGIFYFDAVENPLDEGGIVLVYDEVITDDFEATHLDTADSDRPTDGQVEVYRNNALSEIRPQNTLKVAGRPATDGNYAVVTAGHVPLSERANLPLAPPVQNVDVVNPAVVARKAKQMLRENLQGESLGQITTAPAPVLTPFSVLTAYPACGPNIEPGPPLEYEVESLVHHVSAKRPARGNRRKHETQLRVSLPIRLEDIDIANVSVEQVQNPPSSSGNSWVERAIDAWPVNSNPFF